MLFALVHADDVDQAEKQALWEDAVGDVIGEELARTREALAALVVEGSA